MGYLVRLGFPSFSKAVMSTWLRVPGEVFTIMDGIPPFDTNDPAFGYDIVQYAPPMYRSIPLLSFGSAQVDTEARSTGPSFIGINCDFGSAFAYLACGLQTPFNGSSADAPERPGAFYMGNAVD